MMGEVPWPQMRVKNKQHCHAAVVIIGGGISGKFQGYYDSTEYPLRREHGY
jgi:hypothetical protein